MNEKQKKLGIYKTLGVQLIKKGQWFLEIAFMLTKTPLSKQQVESCVMKATGLPDKQVYMSDEKYLTTSWDTWKDLIKHDWIDRRKYVVEYFDCDNFAENFRSHINEIYGLNTAGRLSVELLDPKTKKHIGYHRCVIIVDNSCNVYLLETQNDKYVEIAGSNPVIGNWEYRPRYIEFN